MQSSSMRAVASAGFEDSSGGSGQSQPLTKVRVCQNCQYSFRRMSSNSDQFCSLDCQTCFQLSPKSRANKQMNLTGVVKDNSQLIYEFQCKIDSEDGAAVLVSANEIKRTETPAPERDVSPQEISKMPQSFQ